MACSDLERALQVVTCARERKREKERDRKKNNKKNHHKQYVAYAVKQMPSGYGRLLVGGCRLALSGSLVC